MISYYWWILIKITIPDWLMQYFRYQTLVQSQSRDLGLLRKQLEQSRLTTHKLRGIIEDLTRSDQLIDQRRFIQLARRTIRKLEGKIWPLDDPDLTLTSFDLDIIWPWHNLTLLRWTWRQRRICHIWMQFRFWFWERRKSSYQISNFTNRFGNKKYGEWNARKAKRARYRITQIKFFKFNFEFEQPKPKSSRIQETLPKYPGLFRP